MKKTAVKKTALITGITGQDGSYLAELLLEKGYFVHGIKRRSSSFNTSRIDHLYQDPHEKDTEGNPPRLTLHYGDLTDSTNLIRIIQQVQPDEIYNLGAQSHVAVSFEAPEYTANSDALGTLRILEAVRILGLTDKTRIYQASTSELYGLVQEIPQKESTPFYPRSPYGVAKLYAYWITVNESPTACTPATAYSSITRVQARETFVTRKITRGSPASTPVSTSASSWATSTAARLGSCPGLRRDAVAHAPAGGTTGRLRHRHWPPRIRAPLH